MSPTITKIVRDKLAAMDDDLLVAAIAVFCSIPAKKNDMFIETKEDGGTAEGLLMRAWEDICYDEALSRGLDSMLEQTETIAAQYRRKHGEEEIDRAREEYDLGSAQTPVPVFKPKPQKAPIVVLAAPEEEIEPTPEELAAEEETLPEFVAVEDQEAIEIVKAAEAVSVGAEAEDDVFANIGFQKHNWQGFQYTNNFRGNR